MLRTIAMTFLTVVCVTSCRANRVETVKGVRARAQAGDLEALQRAWRETTKLEILVAIMEETGRFAGFPRAEQAILDKGILNPETAIRLAATTSAASFNSPAIFSALVERLGDDQPAIREAARAGLAKHGIAARPFLEKGLAEHPSSDVRSGSALLLGRLPRDSEIEAALSKCTTDSHPEVSAACTQSLSAPATE